MNSTVMSINTIVKTPDVCGGAARIDSTRLSVHSLVGQMQGGASIEDLLEGYSHIPLSRAQIHAALAYYYDHQAEIDGLLVDEERLLDQIRDEASALRNSAPQDRYITAREAAEILDLSPGSSQIAHLCAAGELDGRKVANRWFVSRISVQAYATRDRKPGPTRRASS
jgi:uncharacterized protein (DUF433 family)